MAKLHPAEPIDHIVWLNLSPDDESNLAARSEAEAIATSCMARLLGMGLLLKSTDQANSPFEAFRD